MFSQPKISKMAFETEKGMFSFRFFSYGSCFLAKSYLLLLPAPLLLKRPSSFQAAHRQKLDMALQHLQFLPSSELGGKALLTPSAAQQAGMGFGFRCK